MEVSDLKLALYGKEEIDWVSLKEKTKYVRPYHTNHVLICRFWAHVMQLSPADNKQLLAVW